MLRFARSLRCHRGVKETHRVGIFPLHLDPPTMQHCEIFRLLVKTNRGSSTMSCAQSLRDAHGNVVRRVDDGTKLGSNAYEAAATEPASSKGLSFGRLKSNALNDSVVCDSILRRSSSLEHFDEFSRILSECSLAPFDHLILVPNTKHPVTLRQSVHLAAMAVLATRDIPNVHVDLKALEHPDDMMPIVHQLVMQYPKSTIVHWLPNVYEMQNWKNFDQLAKKVPFLLLRPRGWRSASEAAQDALTGTSSSDQPPPGAASSASSDMTTTTSHNPSLFINDPRLGQTASIPKFTGALLDDAGRLSQSSTTTAFSLHRIAEPSKQRKMMPRQWDVSTTPAEMEILEVPRMSGSFVRHELWEGAADVHTLLPPAVLRYVESHGLYRDFRKGSKSININVMHSSRTSTKSGSTAAPALVALEGLIPRLELHYDPNNLLAREHYNTLKPYECLDGRDPDLIVPIGGDGYFMHCVRKNWRRYIPFFGVNAGHLGYLLNAAPTLDELFSAPLKLYQLSMLYCEAETENATGEKQILEELAFNDAWVERATGQTVLIRILVNGEERIRRVRGDGVLMATQAGSTAYAKALGASPVPVGAPLIQLVGSNVVSPAQWKPVHLNQEDCVELECVDNFKRPCRGFVDSVDVGIVSRMLVRTSRVAGVQVAFAESCDLQKKLYALQFPQ